MRGSVRWRSIDGISQDWISLCHAVASFEQLISAASDRDIETLNKVLDLNGKTKESKKVRFVNLKPSQSFKSVPISEDLIDSINCSCMKVAPPSPAKKSKTVEMAQGKWAEVLVHSDRVTKVRPSIVSTVFRREGEREAFK